MELLKTVAKKMLRQNSADHDEKDNKNDKQQARKSEALRVQGADENDPPLEVYEVEVKKSKKKKKKTKKKSVVSGPEAKYKLYKQTMLEIDKTFISNKRPKNPYEFVNKRTHKIEILPGMPYISTSSVDVFEIRNAQNDATALQDSNRFIKATLEIGSE